MFYSLKTFWVCYVSYWDMNLMWPSGDYEETNLTPKPTAWSRWSKKEKNLAPWCHWWAAEINLKFCELMFIPPFTRLPIIQSIPWTNGCKWYVEVHINLKEKMIPLCCINSKDIFSFVLYDLCSFKGNKNF